MSDKIECPVCKTYGSDVLRAMTYGDPCPRCGAPANVIMRVAELRQVRADEELKAELAQVLAELGKVTADRDRLARIVENVREAMADEQDR